MSVLHYDKFTKRVADIPYNAIVNHHMVACDSRRGILYNIGYPYASLLFLAIVSFVVLVPIFASVDSLPQGKHVLRIAVIVCASLVLLNLFLRIFVGNLFLQVKKEDHLIYKLKLKNVVVGEGHLSQSYLRVIRKDYHEIRRTQTIQYNLVFVPQSLPALLQLGFRKEFLLFASYEEKYARRYKEALLLLDK